MTEAEGSPIKPVAQFGSATRGITPLQSNSARKAASSKPVICPIEAALSIDPPSEDEHENGNGNDGSPKLVDADTKLSAEAVKTGQSAMSLGEQESIRCFHIFFMFFAVVVPNAALVLTFSAMGYGLKVYNATSKREYSLYGDGLLCGGCFIASVLIVLDWWRMPRLLKVFSGVIPCIVFYFGAILKGRKYPWAPMLLTLFLMPVLLGVIRLRCCHQVKRKQFYGVVATLTAGTAVAIGVIWAWYILIDGHKWDRTTKESLVAETQDVYAAVYANRRLVYGQDCGPDKNTTYLDSLAKDTRAAIELGCAQAGTLWFLCWMCPFVGIGSDLVITIFCLVTGVIGQMENVRGIQRNLTRFILMVTFLLTGIYASATMSATSLRLGSTIMAFFFTALCLCLVWVATEVDMSVLAHAAKSSKLMQQLVALMQSDWTKAMGVGALGLPLLAFFSLNWLCQKCRKCRNARDTDLHDRFTPLGRKVMNMTHKWNWTNIYIKIVLLGELFFMLQVGVAKITYIFLSWLNTALSDTPLGVVIVLVYIIGGSMFLLPPVPGLPVYVFAGILLGEKGRQEESVGFWFGCVIAMVLGLFTKLCACTGQYAIGYYLGKSIKVQQLIGVDKVPTRAIERILKSRGLSPRKVALLVGGPDWPTSVTCGIVKVNVPQMLLGTLPVIALLAPCILAGACMGRVSPGTNSDWNMLANTFTVMAAVINMASMAYAVFGISQTIQKHGEELAAPRPEHEAVAELTKKEAAEVDCYARLTRWSNLSCCWKAIVLTAAILMLLSNSIFVCFAEMCFRSFAVSSKIKDPYEKDGLDGNVLSIVILPVGLGALVLFCIGCFLHVLFLQVMARRCRKVMKAGS